MQWWAPRLLGATNHVAVVEEEGIPPVQALHVHVAARGGGGSIMLNPAPAAVPEREGESVSKSVTLRSCYGSGARVRQRWKQGSSKERRGRSLSRWRQCREEGENQWDVLHCSLTVDPALKRGRERIARKYVDLES